MMNLAYDLHVHSCLSPCGDGDMTPANIAGIAALRGLGIVTLTDRNTCCNCPTLMVAATEYGLLAMPDVEISTSEEVHAVCLFPALEKALDFDTYVYDRLIKFPNREEIFGEQQTYDARDQVCASEPNLLVNATEISFDGLWNLVRSYGGVMFPAHADKTANSLIANLGFVSPDSCFKTVEVRDLKKLHQLKRDNPYLEQCKIISNSDAHCLEHINEPSLTIQVGERSTEAMVRALLQEQQLFAAGILRND